MSTTNGDSAVAATSDVEARLRWEAQQMRQKPTSYTRGTKDITEIFTSTTNKLQNGELVKDEYFTLFEAVGALEVRFLFIQRTNSVPSLDLPAFEVQSNIASAMLKNPSAAAG